MSVRDTLRTHGRPRIDSITVNGSKIYIRALSGAGRARYLEMVEAASAKTANAASIAALGICEEDGTLVYDASKPEDLAELEEFDGALLAQISLKLFEISGLTQKAADDAAKNSEASPNESSGLSSPATSSTVQ